MILAWGTLTERFVDFGPVESYDDFAIYVDDRDAGLSGLSYHLIGAPGIRLDIVLGERDALLSKIVLCHAAIRATIRRVNSYGHTCSSNWNCLILSSKLQKLHMKNTM